MSSAGHYKSTIVPLVMSWLKGDKTLSKKFMIAFNQKGGIEGWAQVEFALALSNMFTTVQREVPVYTNKALRADIVCTNGIGAAAVHEIVELKCESIFQSGLNANNLDGRIKDDASKFALVDKNLGFTAANTGFTAIGISIANSTTKGLLSSLSWPNKAGPAYDRQNSAFWNVALIDPGNDSYGVNLFYKDCSPP